MEEKWGWASLGVAGGACLLSSVEVSAAVRTSALKWHLYSRVERVATPSSVIAFDYRLMSGAPPCQTCEPQSAPETRSTRARARSREGDVVRRLRVGLQSGAHSFWMSAGRRWDRRARGLLDSHGGNARGARGRVEAGYDLEVGPADSLRFAISKASEWRTVGVALDGGRPGTSNATNLTIGWQHSRGDKDDPACGVRIDAGWLDLRASRHAELAGAESDALRAEHGPEVLLSYAFQAGQKMPLYLGLKLAAMTPRTASGSGRDMRSNLAIGLRFR